MCQKLHRAFGLLQTARERIAAYGMRYKVEGDERSLRNGADRHCSSAEFENEITLRKTTELKRHTFRREPRASAPSNSYSVSRLGIQNCCCKVKFRGSIAS